MNHKRQSWHKFAAAYLMLQSLAVLTWWISLFMRPAWRVYFKPSAAPDFVLLSFLLPDLLLLVGAAWLASWHLSKNSAEALLPLALHTGGAFYALLLCLGIWLATREAALSVLCMTPCAFIPAVILWKLKSELP